MRGINVVPRRRITFGLHAERRQLDGAGARFTLQFQRACSGDDAEQLRRGLNRGRDHQNTERDDNRFRKIAHCSSPHIRIVYVFAGDCNTL